MERLTNGSFDGIRFFVDNPSPPDHKCGGCIFRVRQDRGYTCALVDTNIDLDKGTCMLWVRGIEALEQKDISKSRITVKTAGYVETGVVNCGSCRHYDVSGVEGCALWKGSVDKGQCCMVWEGKDLGTK